MSNDKIDVDLVKGFEVMSMPWLEDKLAESQARMADFILNENWYALAGMCSYWMAIAAAAIGLTKKS